MAIPLIQDYPVPTGVSLDRPPLPWQVAPERAALLIHDMQNYFVGRYASAGFVATLVRRIDALRQRCHALGVPVFYTAQPGDQPRAARGLLMDFWGPGMPQAGDGRAIVAGLEPRDGHDEVLVKHRYSAFARSDLQARLQRAGRDQLVICGVYAHIGCLVTATDAFMADIEPFLVADALGDFSLAHHEMALRHVAHCSGKVVSSAELLQRLALAA
ncbi:hypothetical protein GCM10007860_34170 [Chitiniphilus shinanonensis]|uniref:Isochorismatase-like domain-containing protein n=1 Tax=Chitiniphilus shinanonensis TaxID=553088 RepID=A0ABQ6BXL7_9NEIS|nr:isochorismatase family protein [Chitiniphilus shinanonensis]GLS06244.1 hypothetical protein GCM10007860_34170 [Chitiniphilus shinanonensis]